MPYLTLDDGRSLHEGPAIVQYIADQAPAKNLAPAHGTYERYKLQEWLTFIGTELHKTFSPLFVPTTHPDTKASALERLRGRLKWVDGELDGKQYLMGDQFTVADGYLFTVTNWAQYVGLDLTPYPNLLAYRSRVGARPAAIARMVIVLAETLGLAVIAEGVETAEQQEALAVLGCQHFQGYYFSRPVPAAAFEAFVQAR